MSVKKALTWFGGCVALALLFNVGVYLFAGPQKAMEFFGGYIIEQSLSLDNLFVFIMIFTSFGIKEKQQWRVLHWGIIGAVVLRLIFILLGVTVVNKFHWVLYIFGFILIISGIKMFANKDEDEAPDVKNSRVIKVLRKIIPISDELHGDKFFVRLNKVLYATPLFAILVVVEFSDILFAIDSIPAIFSITTDAFIVYTSNIFAIMGLRNLYFILEKLHNSFRFVKYGVALILTFTGVKLTLLIFGIEIPILTSLIIIFAILVLSILVSVLIKEKPDDQADAAA
jgi:integral membrane protein, TerC family